MDGSLRTLVHIVIIVHIQSLMLTNKNTQQKTKQQGHVELRLNYNLHCINVKFPSSLSGLETYMYILT